MNEEKKRLTKKVKSTHKMTEETSENGLIETESYECKKLRKQIKFKPALSDNACQHSCAPKSWQLPSPISAISNGHRPWQQQAAAPTPDNGLLFLQTLRAPSVTLRHPSRRGKGTTSSTREAWWRKAREVTSPTLPSTVGSATSRPRFPRQPSPPTCPLSRDSGLKAGILQVRLQNTTTLLFKER